MGSGGAAPDQVVFEVQALAGQPRHRHAEYGTAPGFFSRQGRESGGAGAKRGWGLFNNLPSPSGRGGRIGGHPRRRDLSAARDVDAVAALWRVHRMHHADLDFDVTTGARFHPIQIAPLDADQFGSVTALGAPCVACSSSRSS